MLLVSSDFRMVVATLFSSGWKFLTSFDIPGTNMNVVEFAMAGLVLFFVIRKVLPVIHVETSDPQTQADYVASHNAKLISRNVSSSGMQSGMAYIPKSGKR